MATTKPKPKTTEIIIPEDTTAEVTTVKDRLGERTTLKYNAKVEQNDATEINDEAENTDEMVNNENNFSSYSQSDFQEIPKDKIDVIFEELRLTVEPSDYMYAKLTRIPDAMNEKFLVPCRDMQPSGFFQFSLRDRLSFISAIQEQNNNSGGRFHIQILNEQQEPIQYFLGYDNPYSPRKQEIYKPIGAVNVKIPDPAKTEINPTQTGGMEAVLGKLIEVMQNGNQQILQAINAKPQSSQIETLLLTKAVDMITNPPQQNNNFEEKLLTIFAMPQMVDKMATRMFPAPAPIIPDKEMTTFDKVLKLTELPMVQNALERIGDIGEYVVSQKFSQNGATPQPANNQQTDQQTTLEQLPQGEPIDNDMQILIDEVIKELESENELTIENPIFVRLATDYGESFETVKVFCQMAEYPQVLSMLITRASKYNPFPFAPFIENNQWNERGMKLEARLRQVYEILKVSK